MTAGWEHLWLNSQLSQAGSCFAVFSLLPFSLYDSVPSGWHPLPWGEKPSGRNPAVFLFKMVNEGNKIEQSRSSPSRPVWAGGSGGLRGAHCPAVLGTRGENPAGAQAPIKGLHPATQGFVSTTLVLVAMATVCGWFVRVLDKVGRLFLIDPSNLNLAELECGWTIFSLFSLNQECRDGGTGSQDKAATAGGEGPAQHKGHWP